MRRLALIALTALVVTGCQGEDGEGLPGNLRQPGAAVLVGNRLFVSSLPEDALKVVDLEDDVEDDAFVRAPNPIFPLQVPAVRRPDGLAGLEGGEGRRGLVATVSSVDAELRLIDAEALVPLGGPVALPGRPVTVVADPAGDRLYVPVEAPEAGTTAALLVLELASAALQAGGTVGEAPVAEIVASWPLDGRPAGAAVTVDAAGTTVWVSDLGAPELVAVDPMDGTAERIPTGEPLGRLLASPEQVGGALSAGAFVYGLTVSGSGLVAVDTGTRTIAAPFGSGEDLAPLQLPTPGAGLAAMADALIVLESDEGEVRRFSIPMLVTVPLIDGRLAYVHGTRMALLQEDGDFTIEPAFTIDPPVSESGVVDFTAPVLTTREVGGREVAAVDLTPGVTRSRTWSVSFRPFVPGHTNTTGRLSVAADGVDVVPQTPPDPQTARAGDLLQITERTPAAGADCAAFDAFETPGWEIAAVTDGALRLAPLDDGPPLPTAECFDGPFTYSIRAEGYLVTATGLDEVFRLEPGETFTYDGARFAPVAGEVGGPDLRFTLAANQDEAAMAPGAVRVIEVDSGSAPRVVSVRARVDDTFPNGQAPIASLPWIPGTPAVRKDEPEGVSSGRLFIPYAGTGYVAVLDLADAELLRLLQ